MEKRSFWKKISDWGRANALWGYPLMVDCSFQEFYTTFTAEYNIGQTGFKVGNFTAIQSELLVLGGVINKKLLPHILYLHEQMSDPKIVVLLGDPEEYKKMYPQYSLVDDLSQYIKIHKIIPGLPPEPQRIIQGIHEIQSQILKGEL